MALRGCLPNLPYTFDVKYLAYFSNQELDVGIAMVDLSSSTAGVLYLAGASLLA